jgi:hypothetical protein
MGIRRIGGRNMIIKLSDHIRSCRNCMYYKPDVCTYPGGWMPNSKNRCGQYKRKKREAEDSKCKKN